MKGNDIKSLLKKIGCICLAAAMLFACAEALVSALSGDDKPSVTMIAYADDSATGVFADPVEKEADKTAQFEIKNVPEAGVYEIALKFGDSTLLTEAGANSGLINNKYETLKSYNGGVGTSVDGDGYSNYVYDAYLDEGDNTMTLYMAPAVTIKGVSIKLLTEVDAMAVTSTAGSSTVLRDSGGNVMMTGIRLVQSAQDPIETSPATLVIEEDGWYDLSYFGSGANQGEIYFTLTDELGQTIDMCSVNLTWTTSTWVQNGKASSSTTVLSLYTDNSYVIDDNDPKDTIYNPYVRLFEGTYKVTAYSKRLRPYGMDNCQVYFGGAVFATKVDYTDAADHTHSYLKTSETEATCDEVGSATFTCEICGDTFTRKMSDAKGHNWVVVGEVASDGSFFVNCSESETCGSEGYYSVDCGQDGIEQTEATTSEFGVTVAKAGMYKVYTQYSANIAWDTPESSGIKNKAYQNITSYGKTTFNSEYEGYNCYGFYVYLDAGENTLVHYLSVSGTVTILGMRVEFVEDVDAVAMVTSGGGNNIDSKHTGYMLQHRLVQGDSNWNSYEARMTITEDGTYDLSYFAGSANDGNLIVTLESDSLKLVMKSTGLQAETDGWSSSGETCGSSGYYNCALLTHNLYVYDELSGALTDVHEVDLTAGEYVVTVEGEQPNGKRQVWFGGGIFAKKT